MTALPVDGPAGTFLKKAAQAFRIAQNQAPAFVSRHAARKADSQRRRVKKYPGRVNVITGFAALFTGLNGTLTDKSNEFLFE